MPIDTAAEKTIRTTASRAMSRTRGTAAASGSAGELTPITLIGSTPAFVVDFLVDPQDQVPRPLRAKGRLEPGKVSQKRKSRLVPGKVPQVAGQERARDLVLRIRC